MNGHASDIACGNACNVPLNTIVPSEGLRVGAPVEAVIATTSGVLTYLFRRVRMISRKRTDFPVPAQLNAYMRKNEVTSLHTSTSSVEQTIFSFNKSKNLFLLLAKRDTCWLGGGNVGGLGLDNLSSDWGCAGGCREVG